VGSGANPRTVPVGAGKPIHESTRRSCGETDPPLRSRPTAIPRAWEQGGVDGRRWGRSGSSNDRHVSDPWAHATCPPPSIHRALRKRRDVRSRVEGSEGCENRSGTVAEARTTPQGRRDPKAGWFCTRACRPSFLPSVHPFIHVRPRFESAETDRSVPFRSSLGVSCPFATRGAGRWDRPTFDRGVSFPSTHRSRGFQRGSIRDNPFRYLRVSFLPWVTRDMGRPTTVWVPEVVESHTTLHHRRERQAWFRKTRR